MPSSGASPILNFSTNASYREESRPFVRDEENLANESAFVLCRYCFKLGHQMVNCPKIFVAWYGQMLELMDEFKYEEAYSFFEHAQLRAISPEPGKTAIPMECNLQQGAIVYECLLQLGRQTDASAFISALIRAQPHTIALAPMRVILQLADQFDAFSLVEDIWVALEGLLAAELGDSSKNRAARLRGAETGLRAVILHVGSLANPRHDAFLENCLQSYKRQVPSANIHPDVLATWFRVCC